MPKWGHKPIREITKDNVLALLNAKAADRERKRVGCGPGAMVQANRTLTRLRTLFRWAVAENHTDTDPTAEVRARVKERARDRTLGGVGPKCDEAEIRRFWSGCEAIGWPFGPLFQVMLLTAQRKQEVAGMRRSELVNLPTWLISAARAKNGKAHLVHLSPLAVEIIGAMPECGDLVFSTNNRTVVSGFSRAKHRLDAEMTKQLRQETNNPDAEIEPFILHDLRRSASTGNGAAQHCPSRRRQNPQSYCGVHPWRRRHL